MLKKLLIWLAYTISIFGFLRFKSFLGFQALGTETIEFIFSCALAVGGTLAHHSKKN